MDETNNELEALMQFYYYMSHDDPFREMDPHEYKSLHKYFDHLPQKCFISSKEQMFHFRSFKNFNKKNKFTHSGILSCTNFKSCQTYSLDFAAGVFFPLSTKDKKIASGQKIIDVLAKKYQVKIADHVKKRVKIENEFIVKYSKDLVMEPFNHLIRS